MRNLLRSLLDRAAWARFWSLSGSSLSAHAVAVSGQLEQTKTGVDHSTLAERIVLNTLRGYRKEQPCWANRAFRTHALEATLKCFADDLNWSVQAANAIYTLNPKSIRQIDRIIAEHSESRSGIFPPGLHEGRGWSPAAATWFCGDRNVYWRAYRAYSRLHWASIEVVRSPTNTSNIFQQSGYGFSGTRGCVNRLQLSLDVDAQDADAYAETFISAASGLIQNACCDSSPESLWNAVRQHVPYQGRLESTNAAFNKVFLQPDPGQKAQWRFSLTLDRR